MPHKASWEDNNKSVYQYVIQLTVRLSPVFLWVWARALSALGFGEDAKVVLSVRSDVFEDIDGLGWDDADALLSMQCTIQHIAVDSAGSLRRVPLDEDLSGRDFFGMQVLRFARHCNITERPLQSLNHYDTTGSFTLSTVQFIIASTRSENPHVFHPISFKFPPCWLWNSSKVDMLDNDPFSSFQSKTVDNSTVFVTPSLESLCPSVLHPVRVSDFVRTNLLNCSAIFNQTWYGGVLS